MIYQQKDHCLQRQLISSYLVSIGCLKTDEGTTEKISEFQTESEPTTSATPVRWLETGVTEVGVHFLPGTLKNIFSTVVP